MSRRYEVSESFGGGALSIEDGISYSVRQLIRHAPKEADRALRHVGFKVQSGLKSGIREGQVGNRSIPRQSVLRPKARRAIQGGSAKDSRQTTTYTRKRRGKETTRKKHTFENKGRDVSKHIRRPKRFTGRATARNRYLARAIGYQHSPGEVRVGWLSRSAARWGRLVQEGQTITVTPRMRRYYAALGLPLKSSTSTITMPAAPLVAPYLLANRRHFGHWFEMRLFRNLARKAEIRIVA